MASGEWLAESRMVRVIHETGKFWQYMGAETDIGKCLYPEEALYLIDTVSLLAVFLFPTIAEVRDAVMLNFIGYSLWQYLLKLRYCWFFF